MTNMIIHGFEPSTYTRTARIAALELEVEHELVPIAYRKPEHLALHPFGKMPILTCGEATIFETMAILAYLDQNFGAGKLFPAESLVQNLGMISAASDYAYRPVVHQEKDNSEHLLAAATFFDYLERVLQETAWLSGRDIGAADLFVAPMLDYHIKEAGSDHVWSDRPKLEAWFNIISQRRSFIATGIKQA